MEHSRCVERLIQRCGCRSVSYPYLVAHLLRQNQVWAHRRQCQRNHHQEGRKCCREVIYVISVESWLRERHKIVLERRNCCYLQKPVRLLPPQPDPKPSNLRHTRPRLPRRTLRQYQHQLRCRSCRRRPQDCQDELASGLKSRERREQSDFLQSHLARSSCGEVYYRCRRS